MIRVNNSIEKQILKHLTYMTLLINIVFFFFMKTRLILKPGEAWLCEPLCHASCWWMNHRKTEEGFRKVCIHAVCMIQLGVLDRVV